MRLALRGQARPSGRSSRGPAGLIRAALAAAALAGCGGPVGDGADGVDGIGRAAHPIIGGTLDEDTSGVVGLALDLGARVAGHCSGTLIAPNLVLTARHCVALTEEADAEGVVECDNATFRNPFPARMLLASPEPVRPRNPDDPSYLRGREVRTIGDLVRLVQSELGPSHLRHVIAS